MSLDTESIIRVISSVASEYEMSEHRNQLTIVIPAKDLIKVCELLKTDEATLFDMLIDVTGIDWARDEKRFETVYFLYSNKYKSRLRLKVKLDSEEPICPSVVSVWESANWYERETFDMYGIRFDGHPGLRRFYMPEDFVDPESQEPLYPLRKDFPLMGVPDSLPLPPYPEKYGELT